jgi:hypothetical protein
VDLVHRSTVDRSKGTPPFLIWAVRANRTAPVTCRQRAAGRRPAAVAPGGARWRGSPENSKSRSRARFGTRIGSRGSEEASELTEEIEAAGDAAKEEIGAGGSPVGGGAPGFNDDGAARERGEAERSCGERWGSDSPFIGQRRKRRRRPRW